MIPERPWWAESMLMDYPPRWADRMRQQWRKHAAVERGAADAWLRRRIDELSAARAAGVRPGMDDQAICDQAAAEARDMGNELAALQGVYLKKWAHMPADYLARCIVWRQLRHVVESLGARGMGDMLPKGQTEAGIVDRARAPEYWRRALRRAHARTVERCAIALGMVHADGDVYVSRESRQLWASRQAANAAMLANTVAVSEHGDEKTLQELAERSIANPAIRRGELMTRVAGFEACADALGHVKRWAVVTCPGRMHKFTTAGKRAKANPRWDGTNPEQAQRYMCQQWRRLCSWWERQGLRVYGFRTTEPHADGTPHWNFLGFFEPMTKPKQGAKAVPRPAVEAFDEGLRRYFLQNDSPDERGAAEHRVRVEAIDPAKGSAAAYIAKYISKGIDGHGMDVDLFGQDMRDAAPAVVAWARVWGIRQFQQVGGPPVTVWRELRRVHPDNNGEEADNTAELRAAVSAVNLQLVEPGEKKAIAWARFVGAMGGPVCKRKDRPIRILKRDLQGCNRYGEPKQARIVGVVAVGRIKTQPPAHMAHMPGIAQHAWTRPATVELWGERAAWLVVPRNGVEDAFEAHCATWAARVEAQKKAEAIRVESARRVFEAYGEAGRPWTRVNNCTLRADMPTMTPTIDTIKWSEPASSFGHVTIRRTPVGRFFDWAKAGARAERGKHGQT